MDEKTGIQALERFEQRNGRLKKRKEYEYTRHGTSTLISAINVENGVIIKHRLGQTRDEQDYFGFIKEMVNEMPEMDQVIILSDQLNTHMSASLVSWIGGLEEYDPGEMGEKRISGYLKNMESRKLFLEKENHRIRFVFTPKHCSWLNPIENWFAKIQRHIIKNGNFISVADLEDKIVRYIEFYNSELAKPSNWKFKGFTKDKKLKNAIYYKLTG